MRLNQWISLAALLVGGYILWQIRLILLLFLTAIVLATALNQAVRTLQPVVKMKRWLSVVIVLAAAVLLLVLFSVIVFPPFAQQFDQLTQLVPIGIERIGIWIEQAQEVLPQPIADNFRQFINQFFQSPRAIIARLFNNFFAVFSNTLSVVLDSFLVTVLTIMLLASPRSYRNVFLLLSPASYRDRFDEILDKCESSLGGWAVGIIFNMSVITVLSGLGLWLLGVPLALVNALIAGALTFIPNFGPVLSVIPPAIIALIDSPWKTLAVIILYVVIQQVESNLLTPLVMRRQVALLPAFTLLAQVGFAAFFGFLGLFLALPLAIVGQVLIREIVVKDMLNHH
ncbi:MAG: AI-2E family transporter [Elainellaceae cyanobacterium]